MFGKILLPTLAIATFSLGGCATVPEPVHKVVSRNNGYEVREYAGYLVAETTVSGPWKEALNEGFRRLFSYISGNNEGRAKVSMTAPVLSGPPEKIEMTAPVLQETGTGDEQVVSFITPASYTLETIPVPNRKENRGTPGPAHSGRTNPGPSFPFRPVQSPVDNPSVPAQRDHRKDPLRQQESGDHSGLRPPKKGRYREAVNRLAKMVENPQPIRNRIREAIPSFSRRMRAYDS